MFVDANSCRLSFNKWRLYTIVWTINAISTCMVVWFFNTFYFQMASRHNAVHFFNILTSKSAPRPSVSNLFDFQMCFAPQRRALFQYLNFQKCSETLNFWHNLLPNLLRATTPSAFSTSQLPRVLRTPQSLTHFTSKSASRHNAVHFSNISTSKSGPMVRCFVPFHFEIGFAPQRRATFHLLSPQMSPHPPLLASLLFNRPEPHKHEKTQYFATFLPFRAPASSFFWSFFFWLFSIMTAFSSLHIVGSLTSKFSSMIFFKYMIL